MKQVEDILTLDDTAERNFKDLSKIIDNLTYIYKGDYWVLNMLMNSERWEVPLKKIRITNIFPPEVIKRLPLNILSEGNFIAGGAMLYILFGLGRAKDLDIFYRSTGDLFNYLDKWKDNNELGDWGIVSKPESTIGESDNIYHDLLKHYGELPETNIPSNWSTLNSKEDEVRAMTNWSNVESVVSNSYIEKVTDISKDNDIETIWVLLFTNQIPHQHITIIRGTPEEVIGTFDLSICQIAMDSEYLYFGENTLEDIKDFNITVERIHHPFSTYRRIKKYNKFFSLHFKELAKWAKECTEYLEYCENNNIPVNLYDTISSDGDEQYEGLRG